MGFRFRQFEVEDLQSSMRVGTDAMLLGAWATPGPCDRILDIGTGCGVLALMMAQKTIGQVDAIDIDPASAAEAARNFMHSPWASRLQMIPGSVTGLNMTGRMAYDFIISNPPFFTNSLKSPLPRRNQTRHETTLAPEILAGEVNRLLSGNGRFAVILPAETAAAFIETAAACHLHLREKMDVKHRPGAPPVRALMEFSRDKLLSPMHANLTITGSHDKFSADYLALTAGYHQF
jgi:tRNA1Val (adenine37-N6)-methyltransferase